MRASHFILSYLAELLKRDLSIVVLISLDNGAVHKLLELHVVQVAADHHLEHGEELAIRDEAVVVDVVDLEGEAQLIFLGRACTQGVQSLDELEEGDVAILVLVEHCDHTTDEGVLGELYGRADKVYRA